MQTCSAATVKAADDSETDAAGPSAEHPTSMRMSVRYGGPARAQTRKLWR